MVRPVSRAPRMPRVAFNCSDSVRAAPPSSVGRLLPTIAAEKDHAIVNRDVARIPSAVEENWSLTGHLLHAIAAALDAGAAGSRDVGPEIAAAMEVLAGLEYPKVRLFRRALDAISPPPPAAPAEDPAHPSLSAAVEADRIRSFQDSAEPDCGCMAACREFTETYAFHPYWLARPVQESNGSDATGPEPSGDNGGEQRPSPSRVDFAEISRLDFECSYDPSPAVFEPVGVVAELLP